MSEHRGGRDEGVAVAATGERTPPSPAPPPGGRPKPPDWLAAFLGGAARRAPEGAELLDDMVRKVRGYRPGDA